MTEPLSSETYQTWKSVRDGNEDARGKLFNAHRARALGYIKKKLGEERPDGCEPLDILQQAFLCAHRDFESFKCYDGHGAYFGWLRTLIDARITDARRRAGAQKRQAVELPARHQTSPSSAARKGEDRERANKALEQLPEEERELIRLVFWEEMEGKAAAEALGISYDVFKKRKASALKKMGGLL